MPGKRKGLVKVNLKPLCLRFEDLTVVAKLYFLAIAYKKRCASVPFKLMDKCTETWLGDV
jgi:hypothetical protein